MRLYSNHFTIASEAGSWSIHREVGEDYVPEVKPAGEVQSYDPTHRTFDFGGLTLTFPIAPTHFLELITEEEARIRAGGEVQATRVRGPVTVDGIRADGGRWWIVLPAL